jgi:hypothetical protein
MPLWSGNFVDENGMAFMSFWVSKQASKALVVLGWRSYICRIWEEDILQDAQIDIARRQTRKMNHEHSIELILLAVSSPSPLHYSEIISNPPAFSPSSPCIPETPHYSQSICCETIT